MYTYVLFNFVYSCKIIVSLLLPSPPSPQAWLSHEKKAANTYIIDWLGSLYNTGNIQITVLEYDR
jgi:hypothetical protein